MTNLARVLIVVLVSIASNLPGSMTVAQKTQNTDPAHGTAKTANGFVQGRINGGCGSISEILFAGYVFQFGLRCIDVGWSIHAS